MAQHSGANLAHAQQEYFEKVIHTLHENEADFASRLEMKADKNPTNYRGRRVPIETIGNPSLAFGNPAGGDLATPNAPTLNHFTIPYVFMNSGLDRDYESILNESRGQVTNEWRQLVESSGRQFVKWLNIYASQGDGTTKLATCSADYDGTNSTTKKTFICNGTTDSVGASNVIVGQRGFIYDPTGTTQRTGTVGASALVVASKTGVNIVTTTDLPSDYVSGDIFVPEGATPAAGFNGVPALIADSGTIYGVSRTSVPSTKSVMVSAGGGLSAALLYQTYSLVRQRNGGKTGSLELCTGISQYNAYYGLTIATGVMQFNHQGASRPATDIGGANPDEFTWFGVKINCFLNWVGTRIDFLNFMYLKTASLKAPGQMLPPFDKPLPAINGTTSNYKMAEWRWLDVALQWYTPAGHRHGALTGLDLTGLPTQKNLSQ